MKDTNGTIERKERREREINLSRKSQCVLAEAGHAVLGLCPLELKI